MSTEVSEDSDPRIEPSGQLPTVATGCPCGNADMHGPHEFDREDPREEAAAQALFEMFGSNSRAAGPGLGHRLRARQIISAIDAADRAAGIRRVTQPDAHDSESYCHRCEGPNVSWSAPSPLWNQVMRSGSIDGPCEWESRGWGEIICPTCFAVLAEQAGVATGWQLVPRAVHVELQTVTPSGRVWSEEKQLWVDGA